MGKSMISFNEETLWIHDFYFEPIIFLTAKQLKYKIDNNLIQSQHQTWFKEYYKLLCGQFSGARNGAMDLEFDDLNQNEYRFSTVKLILTNLFVTMNSLNIELTKDSFGIIEKFEFGNYANWEGSPTSIFKKKVSLNSIELAKKIKDLIVFIS